MEIKLFFSILLPLWHRRVRPQQVEIDTGEILDSHFQVLDVVQVLLPRDIWHNSGGGKFLGPDQGYELKPLVAAEPTKP